MGTRGELQALGAVRLFIVRAYCLGWCPTIKTPVQRCLLGGVGMGVTHPGSWCERPRLRVCQSLCPDAQVLHGQTLHPHMFLFSNSPIKAGEELLLDYGDVRLPATPAACPVQPACPDRMMRRRTHAAPLTQLPGRWHERHLG